MCSPIKEVGVLIGGMLNIIVKAWLVYRTRVPQLAEGAVLVLSEDQSGVAVGSCHFCTREGRIGEPFHRHTARGKEITCQSEYRAWAPAPGTNSEKLAQLVKTILPQLDGKMINFEDVPGPGKPFRWPAPTTPSLEIATA